MGDGFISSQFEPNYTFYSPGNFDITLIVSNESCTDTMTKTVEVLLRKNLISEFLNDDLANQGIIDILNINLYPNPTTGYITIEAELAEEADIQIDFFNVAGAYLGSDKLHGQHVYGGYDFSKYARGYYIARVSTGQKMKYIKFVTVN